LIPPTREKLKNAIEANSIVEYLEVASLTPFLRLFADDTSCEPLTKVVRRLARDHAAVWKETVNPLVIHELGRRFVVMLAAMEIYSLKRIRIELPWETHWARTLMPRSTVRFEPPPRVWGRSSLAKTRHYCCGEQFWRHLEGEKHTTPLPQDFSADMSHSIILVPMVRFVVRLLHIYSSNGEHVEQSERKAVKKLNLYLHEIFTVAYEKNPVAPLRQITELWSLQYLLSKKALHDGCLFKLSDAVALMPLSPD